MSNIIQKIKGKEYILLSYPFRSNHNSRVFQQRCLDLGGFLQGAKPNEKQSVITVTALIPTDKMDEFKRLEAEDKANKKPSMTVGDLYRDAFKAMGICFAVVAVLGLIYYGGTFVLGYLF